VQADTLQQELGLVLNRFESELHVVAHTPVDEIAHRYEGALLTVDLNAPATQLLLLAREADRLWAFRYGAEGPAELLQPD